jgi:parallel beta-helix repeat protein
MTHNFVHDNVGAGLWADGGNFGSTFEYNKITDNWAGGIEYEISYDAVIAHNEIAGNGRRHKGWAWDAGIEIVSSGGGGRIEINDNVLTGNANAITLIDNGRAWEQPTPHGAHVVQNVWVHGNTITMGPKEGAGAVQDSGSASIFKSNNNRFDENVYILNSLSDIHFAWADSTLRWDQWRSTGNDSNGRAQAMPQ